MSQLVHAETDGTKIIVTCDSFSNRDYVGLIPGAKWREDEGHWDLNLTWASCKQLRSTFGEDLELGDFLVQWGFHESKSRVQPCMSLRGVLNPGQPYPVEFDQRLYPYQVAGAQFLAATGQGILSDPPGAGKTATSISAAKILNTLPALVIAPKSTLVSWGREIERWWPETPTYVIDGTREKRAEAILECGEKRGVCIINWEAVRLHSRLAPYGSTALRHCSSCDRTSDGAWTKCERCTKELNMVDWQLVIADEGHRMAKASSKQTRAVWAIGQGLGRQNTPEYRWILTGTPLTNQIDTLYCLLHFIDPLEWPSRVAYIDRYALTRIVPWGTGSEVIGLNPLNEDEFQEIFQPRFRRMPKEIILPQLPPIIRTRRYVEMSDIQRRCYEEMAEDMVTETESGELLIAANPAVKMLRMVQFSSATVDLVHPDLDECLCGCDEPCNCDCCRPDPADRLNIDRAAKLLDPSNKLDALMDDLPDLLEAGESVIVFAVSRQLIEMAEIRLKTAKIKYGVIKGNQKASFRQSQIDDFQNKITPVILVVIAAGGTGINLTAGRIEIFLQRAWDYVSNHQAEGRGHRIGSEIHDSIEIIDYISAGTVDETVIQVAEGKEISLERVVRDRDAIRKILHGEVDDERRG